MPGRKQSQKMQKPGMQSQDAQDDEDYLSKTRKIVSKHQDQTGKTPALFKSLKNKYIALKYKTKVSVEGVGEYEVEVTNVVNTKTLKEKSYVPSLMSMANV